MNGRRGRRLPWGVFEIHRRAGWGGAPKLRLEVRVDNSEEELSILIRPRRYGGSFSKRYLEGWGAEVGG